MDRGSTIARSDGVVEAQFDDVRVVLNEDLAYLGLNAVGQRIWDLLAAPQTLGSLVEVLLEEYDVAEADCATDVTRYVEALVDHKLVRLS
ncbi:PqqD family peptide modification chaperone [Nocardioides stalactiti]|uniref:PqqD family peptide modification chaperone n=1 Tax=Nocardioides stalactiti TaxID=2755356 RepID=UPI001604081C|nr:PqqD family peptide modification chaperone [Nocardioides stalactiti]